MTKYFSIPESTSQNTGEADVLIIEAAPNTSASLQEFLTGIANDRNALLRALSEHGALLFRGYLRNGDADFDAAIRAFGLDNFRYADSLSNAVRSNRTERVFTANEAPSHIEIFLHHEMAQTPVYPSRLFFYCEQAPDSGGATPLCRSDRLLESMAAEQPAFLERCRDEGLRYTNVMPAEADAASGQGRSWMSTLGTSDRAAAEAKLTKLGYSWNWLESGDLRVTTPVLPAVRRAPGGQEVFFNQLIAAFQGWNDKRNEREKSVTFGTGEALDDADLERTCELAALHTVDVDWKRGDLVLVDNYLMMHGRRPFEGKRSILASLVAADA